MEWYDEIQKSVGSREDYFNGLWNQDVEKSESGDIQKNLDIIKKAHEEGRLSDSDFEIVMNKVRG